MGITYTNKQWTTYRILDQTIDNVDLADPLNLGESATGKGFILWADTALYRVDWDEAGDGGKGSFEFGADQKGVDVKFFGASASHYLHWDQSVDDLVLYGANARIISESTVDASNTTSGSIQTDGGVGIAMKLFVGTNLDVAGTSALDGNVTLSANLYLPSAGVIDFGTADVTITHSTNALTIAGGTANFSGQLKANIATETTSVSTGSFVCAGGVGIAKKLWIAGGIIMTTGEIDMTTGASGSYGLRLRPNSADALSITRGATDMVVFNSSTPSILITPATTITGNLTLSSALSVDGTTDTSSTVTGSIHTDGGLGIAKKIWLGTGLIMDTGEIDMTTATTGSYGIRLKTNSADALSITRGATDMMVFNAVTPSITITPATTITGVLTLGSNLNMTGVGSILSQDSTTDTTSTTTGSIHTDGGVGVAKKVWIGTGLIMDTGEIDMTGALSGSYGLRLRPNSADALSITGGATDMMVFKTTAPSRITITPVTAIEGMLRAEGGLYVEGTVTLPAGSIVGTHIADNTIAPGHMRSDLGADYGPGGVTSITVVNGMVTACS